MKEHIITLSVLVASVALVNAGTAPPLVLAGTARDHPPNRRLAMGAETV